MCREVCVSKVEIYEVKLMSVKKSQCRKGVVLGEVHGDMFMEVRGSLGREIFVDLEVFVDRDIPVKKGLSCVDRRS